MLSPFLSVPNLVTISSRINELFIYSYAQMPASFLNSGYRYSSFQCLAASVSNLGLPEPETRVTRTFFKPRFKRPSNPCFKYQN